MARYEVETWGVGAVLVCRSGGDVQRYWLPSKREAELTRSRLEAGGGEITPRPPNAPCKPERPHRSKLSAHLR